MKCNNQLQITKIPPKGKTWYYRDQIIVRFGVDWTARIRQQGPRPDQHDALLGVMVLLVGDCGEHGINPYELLERAIAMDQEELEELPPDHA